MDSEIQKKVLRSPVSIRVRDVLRQVAFEHELEVFSDKVAEDHVHMFIGYCPTQNVSKIMQWLKGISSRILLQEFTHLKKKQFWGRHLWARRYLAVSSGNITDESIRKYIDAQDSDPVVALSHLALRIINVLIFGWGKCRVNTRNPIFL